MKKASILMSLHGWIGKRKAKNQKVKLLEREFNLAYVINARLFASVKGK